MRNSGGFYVGLALGLLFGVSFGAMLRDYQIRDYPFQELDGFTCSRSMAGTEHRGFVCDSGEDEYLWFRVGPQHQPYENK